MLTLHQITATLLMSHNNIEKFGSILLIIFNILYNFYQSLNIKKIIHIWSNIQKETERFSSIFKRLIIYSFF
jgi:hypothetical protein